MSGFVYRESMSAAERARFDRVIQQVTIAVRAIVENAGFQPIVLIDVCAAIIEGIEAAYPELTRAAVLHAIKNTLEAQTPATPATERS